MYTTVTVTAPGLAISNIHDTRKHKTKLHELSIEEFQ